ncbi:DNA/RNA non-specific endonuclease [Scopulibacillus cellulosilyticus]|uniref:DNA/RNA non-specific endonuclease n=1 Tax=Scopulibacillus cellulosilyticus TaxID=2665665 RepID=A0ABW2PYQ2_9BACL
MDQSLAVVKRTVTQFRQADESWFGQLLDIGAEIFQAVKHQSLGLTNKIVKKVGNIRLPQVLQPEFAGIGKVETTVGDVVKSAKDTMMKAVGREVGGSVTVHRAEESSRNISRPNDGIIRDGSHMDESGRLKPNVKYKTGEYEYIYKTDELGRLNEFNADNLKLTVREERLPHKSNTPGKQPGDHAGHLAGNRFGGSPELDNLVSQSSKVNLSNYKKLENQWAKAISKGKEVSVKVKVHYDRSELRPSSFEVKYKIDGAVKKRVFRN